MSAYEKFDYSGVSVIVRCPQDSVVNKWEGGREGGREKKELTSYCMIVLNAIKIYKICSRILISQKNISNLGKYKLFEVYTP